jgi:outer membrane protein insertion porin family
VDRSRQRLQRIGYFEDVNIETPAVEGSEDQVDIIVSVEERSTGSFQVGLGYSQLQGLIASISVQQQNFLGSGRTVGFAVSRSRINRQVNISYTNPFWTDDGVSRGFFVNYSEFNQGRANISAFSTSQAAAGVNFGFPVTEVDFIRLGASYQDLDINIGEFITVPIDPDDPEGPATIELAATRPLAITLDRNGDGILQRDERQIQSFNLNGSWGRDTRNHFLTPTRGSLNRLTFDLAAPGSTREYYTVAYRGRKYWPLGENWPSQSAPTCPTAMSTTTKSSISKSSSRNASPESASSTRSSRRTSACRSGSISSPAAWPTSAVSTTTPSARKTSSAVRSAAISR